MKYILLTLLITINMSCSAQNYKTYRLFDRELEMELMTFEIDDENNINVKITNKEDNENIIFSETLNNTTDKNIFALKTDLFKDKNKKGFALLEFIEDGKIISMYDSIFQNKIQIEKFISKPLNLKKSMAIYLIQDLSLEKIEKFPSITEINEEKLNLLKLKIKDREKYLEEIPENLEMKEQFAIYIKGKMWLNIECLLLGYKFPLDKYENEFILNKIKE
jgi:hypothetical protein